MILPLGSHLQAGQEPEMSYPWRGELQRWFVAIRNSKHTKNHGISSTCSMNKFIFYRGHCLILPLPCLIKDCGNELDWAPGTINSQRGLYRWLDWMMVLTALFSVNRIPKVPPKIGGWASNCFIHWWIAMGFSPRGSCFLTELDPSWSISLEHGSSKMFAANDVSLEIC